MLRLGHISFFGIAFINVAFAATVSHVMPDSPSTLYLVRLCSWLLIFGAITMPFICYLSAFKKAFRHVFFVPVVSVILAAAIFIFGVLLK